MKVAQTDDDDAYVSNVNHVKFSLRRGAAPDLFSWYVQSLHLEAVLLARIIKLLLTLLQFQWS